MAPDGICDCGRVIVQPEIGRHRRKCYICSPPDRRDRSERRAPVVTLPVREPDPSELTLVEATRAALAEAGIGQSWEGVACVKLAELIDSAKHGASGAAGNTKAHREAMQYALSSAGANADVLDIVDRIFLEN
jgi:hypothetical protein